MQTYAIDSVSSLFYVDMFAEGTINSGIVKKKYSTNGREPKYSEFYFLCNAILEMLKENVNKCALNKYEVLILLDERGFKI